MADSDLLAMVMTRDDELGTTAQLNDASKFYKVYDYSPDDPFFTQLQALLKKKGEKTFRTACRAPSGLLELQWGYAKASIQSANFIILLGAGRHPVQQLINGEAMAGWVLLEEDAELQAEVQDRYMITGRDLHINLICATRGGGRLLFAEVLSIARSRGYSSISLEAVEDYLIPTYERWGFIPIPPEDADGNPDRADGEMMLMVYEVDY